MASKHVGHVWFNGRSQIGIVLCFDEITQKPKAYINTFVGMDEEDDVKHIQEYGMKFPVLEATTIIGEHGTVKEEELYNKIVDQITLETEAEEEARKSSDRPDKS
jgi:hypothetical protein